MERQLRITKRPGTGVLTAWIEHGNSDEVFIRESLDRGRDVQTVALTQSEVERVLSLFKKV